MRSASLCFSILRWFGTIFVGQTRPIILRSSVYIQRLEGGEDLRLLVHYGIVRWRAQGQSWAYGVVSRHCGARRLTLILSFRWGSMPLAVRLRIQMISGMRRLSITGGVCIQ